MNIDPGTLAVAMLLASRRDDDAARQEASPSRAHLTAEEGRLGVADDAAKLAFWIDIYNAVVQHQPPGATATTRSRMRLFGRSIVVIAGQRLSLDDIEHGLLRRSRWKLSLGYLGNPRPSTFERSHRVAHIDARIHFALNCGARSCPPIAAYEADHIGDQLERASRAYLATEVIHDGATLRVPTVLWWFLGDFGGVTGMRCFLARHGVEGSTGRIRFLRYDWTPAPDRWSGEG
jgi:hypothetical protein